MQNIQGTSKSSAVRTNSIRKQAKFSIDIMPKKISSVHFSCSVMLTLCDPMNRRTPGLPVHHQLPEFTKSHVHSISEAIQTSLSSLLLPPSIFPGIRVFSNESVLQIRWPRCQSFSFNISPSSEYLGLIYFRMDWLDLLAVQGTLKESSPTPHFKSINSSVLNRLYSRILTSIHDYWKNYSLDQTDLCQKSNISAF